MFCLSFFSGIGIISSWVGLGSDDKHLLARFEVVSDFEELNLHGFQVFFKEKRRLAGWLVGVFAPSSRVFYTDEEKGFSLTFAYLNAIRYQSTTGSLMSSYIIHILYTVYKFYMHDNTACILYLLSSFFPNRQKATQQLTQQFYF